MSLSLLLVLACSFCLFPFLVLLTHLVWFPICRWVTKPYRMINVARCEALLENIEERMKLLESKPLTPANTARMRAYIVRRMKYRRRQLYLLYG